MGKNSYGIKVILTNPILNNLFNNGRLECNEVEIFVYLHIYRCVFIWVYRPIR